MIRARVIPSLLLRHGGLVKTRKFRDPVYLGDPVNIVRIFNDKEVDELVVLDIAATLEGTPPHMDILADLASECFMPLSYGGGLRDVETMRRILAMGFEKVVINSQAAENPDLVSEAAADFGSQSVVISMDVKKNLWGGYEVLTHGGTRRTKCDPVSFARRMENLGAGEILLNSIDRDGTLTGYDQRLIRAVAESVEIPVIACGGARSVDDFVEAVKKSQASAVAAGAMFVFHGPHRAVLINTPDPETTRRALA